MILRKAKEFVRRHPLLEGAAYMVQNNLVPQLNFSGTSVAGLSADEAADYVLTVADRYREAARRLGRSVAEATVLEVGPGDNLGVAVCLVGWGAAAVVCLDRFDCLGPMHHDRTLYRSLLQKLPEAEADRIRRHAPWLDQPGQLPDGAISYITGARFEAASRPLGGKRFDAVLSNAVLEHVDDPAQGLAQIAPLLRHDGWMFHEVDLRCHGRFEAWGPLYFLTIRESLWRLMGSRLGIPNRLRAVDYLRTFEDLGMNVDVEVLESVSREAALEAYPRMARRGACRSAEDLMPSVIRIYARGQGGRA